MEQQRILTIAIPTGNRRGILLEGLSNIASELRESHIEDAVAISIIDNCSTDGTSAGVEEFGRRNPDICISIRGNKAKCGVDENMDSAVGSSKTEWTWLLGDDDRITAGSLAYVVAKLQSLPPDVSFLTFAYNIYNCDLTEVLEDNSGKYHDDLVFQGVTPENARLYHGHLLLSAHVFRTAKWAAVPDRQKYYGSIFLQMYVLFYHVQRKEKILLLKRVCLDYRKDNSVKDENGLYEIFYGFMCRLPQIIKDTVLEDRPQKLLIRSFFFPFHILSFRKIEDIRTILPSKRALALFNASMKSFSFMPEFWLLYPWQLLTPPFAARALKYAFDLVKKPNSPAGAQASAPAKP